MKITRILALATALVMSLSAVSCAKSDKSSKSSSAASSAADGADTSPRKHGNKNDDEEPAPSAVSFSKESGVYADSFDLELTTEESGDIYYTLDGSDPTNSDTRIKYESPIAISDRSSDPNVVSAVDPGLISGNFTKYDRKSGTYSPTVSAPEDSAVDKCTVIKAAVISDSGASSVCSHTYFIGTPEQHIPGIKESCDASGDSLAVISISMDYDDLFDSTNGIYVKGDKFDEALAEKLEKNEDLDEESARKMPANYNQRGREWERECQVDFLEYDADGAAEAFSQTCGIRIQGNYSRSDWQKGFRLYARKDYGHSKFSYAVFGEDLKDDYGETIDHFKTLELRAGGNCAFTAKFNDIYWQDLSSTLDCETKASRPCVVYLNGEYWGVYILEEDYSEHYFEEHHDVDNNEVIVYKGDAETYAKGYKLDEGELPEGETSEDYYLNELKTFFREHKSLEAQEDYDEFAKLVDVESVRDYFLAEVWINNKWDWPGKNWSMWKTASVDPDNEYADGRWRFMFYDMEFGGVSGSSDCRTNTVKEDNYKPKGLLDFGTTNPAVLCYAYLMTNADFRADFNDRLNSLADGIYERDAANAKLDEYTAIYTPLYDQFFDRYPGSGDTDNAINGGYASVRCIKDFLEKRSDNISKITDWIDKQYK